MTSFFQTLLALLSPLLDPDSSVEGLKPAAVRDWRECRIHQSALRRPHNEIPRFKHGRPSPIPEPRAGALLGPRRRFHKSSKRVHQPGIIHMIRNLKLRPRIELESRRYLPAWHARVD